MLFHPKKKYLAKYMGSELSQGDFFMLFVISLQFKKQLTNWRLLASMLASFAFKFATMAVTIALILLIVNVFSSWKNNYLANIRVQSYYRVIFYVIFYISSVSKTTYQLMFVSINACLICLYICLNGCYICLGLINC